MLPPSLMTPFKTFADPLSTEMPGGIPFIIGNEAAERFSYYGMKAILVIYMTQHLLDSSGRPDPMSETEAQGYYHLFISAVYALPLLGALLADTLFGKYRTILLLSLVYCLGHFSLALDDTRLGLMLGLGLIALGAGGIKPCVSAHVGDQFGPGNRHLMAGVFGWFYFSINLGAFAAILIIPWLLDRHGASTAFSIPGVLMLFATLIFWCGRHRYIHIKPSGSVMLNDLCSREGVKILARLCGIYAFIAIFWALFEQTGSSWVLQAQKMDRQFVGLELLPSQIQAANPILIMILTPCFVYGLYPWLGRSITFSALFKMKAGLFLTVAAFAIPGFIQLQLDQGRTVHIVWQLPAYLLLTSAEVMVSITCLEFSYTQAPGSMKSLVMALYLSSIALGNLLTSAVNFMIENDDGTSKLAGADYFWFFTALMLMTALLFAFAGKGLGNHFQDDS
ncbi:MAG: POT-type proton-dependent oligopeptide transporter [Gammaproteobacteria bacterium]